MESAKLTVLGETPALHLKQTAFRISDYFLKTGMVMCGFDPLWIVGDNHLRFSDI